jgi:transposase InsO family protein
MPTERKRRPKSYPVTTPGEATQPRELSRPATTQRELIDLRGPWKGISDVPKATMEWVEWYNTKGIHSYCKNVPPLKYEEAFYQSQASVA